MKIAIAENKHNTKTGNVYYIPKWFGVSSSCHSSDLFRDSKYTSIITFMRFLENPWFLECMLSGAFVLKVIKLVLPSISTSISGNFGYKTSRRARQCQKHKSKTQKVTYHDQLDLSQLS